VRDRSAPTFAARLGAGDEGRRFVSVNTVSKERSSMKNVNERKLLLLAACGLACGLATVAQAQPYYINITGATLQENFLKSPSSTRDYINVDNDAFSGSGGTGNEQLAGNSNPADFGASNYWFIQYRATGSVNGLRELLDFGTSYLTTADGVDLKSADATLIFFNRAQFFGTGATAPALYNSANPGGSPLRTLTDGSFLAAPYVAPSGPSTGAVGIDIAALDVPTLWASQGPAGTLSVTRTPEDAGYGQFIAVPRTKTGGTAGTAISLPTLGSRNVNLGSPDANTVYDTKTAVTPVAAMTNLGTGLRQTTVTDLRHLAVTGRRLSGENLVQVTRDVGSGTHNAYMNSLGLDPSSATGENIGNFNNSGSIDILGPAFLPSNKGGSSRMEGTVFNHRLAVGYSGAERGINSAWLPSRAEVLGVQYDIRGGTTFARPTIDAILDNATYNGYMINGPAIFATIGDPLSAPVLKGGDAGNTNPDMRNVEAAAYVNNVTRSITAFVALPGADDTLFSPGEYFAANFVLFPAPDRVQSDSDGTLYITNPQADAGLKTFVRNQSVLKNAAYATFNTTAAGRVPTRTLNNTYSDGITGTTNTYILQSGASSAVYGSSTFPLRNKISGDFNGNAVRDGSDIAQLVAAWRWRNGLNPSWAPIAGSGDIVGTAGNTICVEIIGDFDGDGNFGRAWNGSAFVQNRDDVRYFADGLATYAGALNRKQGFTDVDVAFGGNFFGTTLATGAAYTNGAARADIAGGSAPTKGWEPIGSNGVVNAADIDYVYDQFKTNPAVTDGAATWSNLAEAATFDLSADMTGDLVVDQADINEIVVVILGTVLGDINLDGVLDQVDCDIATPNLNLAGTYATGDVDGDGTVTAADLAIICGDTCGDTDFDNDGDAATDADIEAFFAVIGGVGCPTASCDSTDFDGDGDEGTDADIEAFFRVIGGGACSL